MWQGLSTVFLRMGHGQSVVPGDYPSRPPDLESQGSSTIDCLRHSVGASVPDMSSTHDQGGARRHTFHGYGGVSWDEHMQDGMDGGEPSPDSSLTLFGAPDGDGEGSASILDVAPSYDIGALLTVQQQQQLQQLLPHTPPAPAPLQPQTSHVAQQLQQVAGGAIAAAAAAAGAATSAVANAFGRRSGYNIDWSGDGSADALASAAMVAATKPPFLTDLLVGPAMSVQREPAAMPLQRKATATSLPCSPRAQKELAELIHLSPPPHAPPPGHAPPPPQGSLGVVAQPGGTIAGGGGLTGGVAGGTGQAAATAAAAAAGASQQRPPIAPNGAPRVLRPLQLPQSPAMGPTRGPPSPLGQQQLPAGAAGLAPPAAAPATAAGGNGGAGGGGGGSGPPPPLSWLQGPPQGSSASAHPGDSRPPAVVAGPRPLVVAESWPWGTPIVRLGSLPIANAGASRIQKSLSLHVARTVVIQYQDLHVMQQIGEGGFGKVYLGMWRGTAVAIKLASYMQEQEQALEAEFHREVTTMSNIPKHPNVLSLLGACTQPPTLALVTDYCSGGSLYYALHTPGVQALPLLQLLRTCLGIARGMCHLHACHVLHRDLKSANLLLDAAGTVKICDFGLSRIVKECAPMTGGLGTHQWMAPEVLAHQRYSDKADVYSFAIVMYELLTRRLPYSGMTAVQAALGVVNCGLRPVLPTDAPPPLVALVVQCWAAVPDQRPRFDEVVTVLEDLVAQAEPPAPPLPPPPLVPAAATPPPRPAQPRTSHASAGPPQVWGAAAAPLLMQSSLGSIEV